MKVDRGPVPISREGSPPEVVVGQFCAGARPDDGGIPHLLCKLQVAVVSHHSGPGLTQLQLCPVLRKTETGGTYGDALQDLIRRLRSGRPRDAAPDSSGFSSAIAAWARRSLTECLCGDQCACSWSEDTRHVPHCSGAHAGAAACRATPPPQGSLTCMQLHSPMTQATPKYKRARARPHFQAAPPRLTQSTCPPARPETRA